MKKKAKTKEKTDPYAHLDQSDLLGTHIVNVFFFESMVLSVQCGFKFAKNHNAKKRNLTIVTSIVK